MLRGVAVLIAVACVVAERPAHAVRTARAVTSQTQKTLGPGNIRGVWKVEELASRAPGAEWEVRPAPYLSQYIFTDKHYSYMYVPGAGPRKRFAGDPNAPSDAEKVEAYNSLVAATGTYSLSGQTLTLTARIHKNPNEMTGEPLVYAVEITGTTLRMTVANPKFLPGREWRTVLTRVE